ncbi:HesB/YadR/YfhF family protein [Camelliibacillus cellulosilyticus]|uniref:HesB/YadR/YfhF family protein n=1 Tax=Camelliibacillus cellulosilyticus TaxID=2174486 RepID=A0ABV9GL24_9BACL
MQIIITEEALEWFKDEFQLTSGDAIRFYVRYGGASPIQEGFSLGVMADSPNDPSARVEIEGIHFFVEAKDAWYFKDYDLKVVTDKNKEIDFQYI